MEGDRGEAIVVALLAPLQHLRSIHFSLRPIYTPPPLCPTSETLHPNPETPDNGREPEDRGELLVYKAVKLFLLKGPELADCNSENGVDCMDFRGSSG